MPKRDLKLQWPLAGVNRRLAAGQQPPFTTPHAVNVRPEGPLERRVRGGSRPGLVKTSPTKIGMGSPIYMAAMMRSLKSEGRLTVTETFADLDDWTAMDSYFAEIDPDPVSFDGGFVLYQDPFYPGWLEVVSQENRGSVFNDGMLPGIEDATTNIINGPYSVEVKIRCPVSIVGPIYVWLYARLDDTSPSPLSNVVARVNIHVNAVNLGLGMNGLANLISEGSLTYPENPSGDFWLSLHIDNNVAKAQVAPVGDCNIGPISIEWPVYAPKANESRVGLRVNNRANYNNIALDDFRVRYFDSAPTDIPSEALVVASKHAGTAGKQGSNVWYESAKGTMTEVPCDRDGTGSAELTDLAHGVHLMAVDHLGKLFIADHGVKASGTDGEVADDPWTVFSVAAGTNWEETHADAIGVDEHGDWLEILSTGTSGYAILGVYKIVGVSDTNITVDRAMAATSNEEAIRYRIVRGAKVFDPSAAAGARLTRWEPTAVDDDDVVQPPPLNCTIIEAGLRDRVILGGDDELPGVFYCSRADDWYDFWYGHPDTDPERAFASNAVDTDVGGLAIPLSAITVLAEDYTVFSAESEMYIYRGDPGYGAIMGNISRQIGVGSRTAHCRIPDGSLVFMTRDGLYKYHPRASPEPVPLSRDKLPEELLDVVQNTSLIVSLEYDVRGGGVHIYVVPITAGPTTHYFFHWETQSFNPVTLGSTDFEPTALVFSAKSNRLILAGRDGYLRHYDTAAKDDDGTAVTKEVDFGPIPFNHGQLAIAESLEFVLDDNSDDVSWSFRSGQTPEEAFTATPRASGTVSAGPNYLQPVRHSGQWGFLRLSTTGSARWALESARLRVLTTPAEQRII